MSTYDSTSFPNHIETLEDMAKHADYSFMNNLSVDPQANNDGYDHSPRQVFSGHFVKVKPTPLVEPKYVAHSATLFNELGFTQNFAATESFRRLFSGDMAGLPDDMKPFGWATGYALSIYGTEYIQQCPFQTGNGYGDGRAISVFEGVLNGRRWEMQLKGGGRTPYCRGADGRAVLRSSMREFLAQEHMHALGVPTSRSLSLFVSQSEQVMRPWYSEGSETMEPDTMMLEPTAITTRVASSFLRVGQLELFARRAKREEHAKAVDELRMIVKHLIQREYAEDVSKSLPLEQQIPQLVAAFRDRLTSLVAHWLRVGYCQGNFNSDNCACGGYTLDYGPFGFCERFEPFYQPWTGGGRHFSFFNQPAAAKENFVTFCGALEPLLTEHPDIRAKIDEISRSFSNVMQTRIEHMWAAKLGLQEYNEDLTIRLLRLMVQTPVDYTKFFRALSKIPDDTSELTDCFYERISDEKAGDWSSWLSEWHMLIDTNKKSEVSRKMKKVNPKYTWREWLIVPAYKQAKSNNFALVSELQEVLTTPYGEQSREIEAKYCRLRPEEFLDTGGISHYSCSS